MPGGAALIVECQHALGRCCHVGDDKADARIKLVPVPLAPSPPGGACQRLSDAGQCLRPNASKLSLLTGSTCRLIVGPMLADWLKMREQVAAFDKAVRTEVKEGTACAGC